MVKDIVVIDQSAQHRDDRSWQAKSEMEAAMMVKWLKDNGVEASYYSQEEWERLPQYVKELEEEDND